uniref:Serine/threonine-protein kinase TOR n=1 Tax=Panagrellus redivivus TaxID=6233 RepID=A0A7E4VP56_PANRE
MDLATNGSSYDLLIDILDPHSFSQDWQWFLRRANDSITYLQQPHYEVRRLSSAVYESIGIVLFFASLNFVLILILNLSRGRNMTDNKVDENDRSPSTAEGSPAATPLYNPPAQNENTTSDSPWAQETDYSDYGGHGPEMYLRNFSAIKTYHGRALGDRFGISTFLEFSTSRSIREVKQAAGKIDAALKIAQESEYDKIFEAVAHLLEHFEEEVVMSTVDHLPSLFAICKTMHCLVLKKANEKLVMPFCRLIPLSPKVQNGVFHALTALITDDCIGIHELQSYVIPWLFDFMREFVAFREPLPPKKAEEAYNNNRPVVATILHKVGLKLDKFPFKWAQTFFAPKFSTLLSDQSVGIRRMAILTMGSFAAVFGPNFVEKQLLPHLQKAVHDPNERIRKAVCDILSEVAQHSSPEVRNTKLVKLYNVLVKDGKRHVQHYALQKIGSLVLIFADPVVNNLDYNDGDVLHLEPERAAELKRNAVAEASKKEAIPLPSDFELPPSERPSTPSPSTSAASKPEEFLSLNVSDSLDEFSAARLHENGFDGAFHFVDQTSDDCPALTDFETEHGTDALYDDDDPLNQSFANNSDEDLILTEADLEAAESSDKFEPMSYWRTNVDVSDAEFARFDKKSAGSDGGSIASNDLALSKASCDLSSAGLGSPEKSSNKSAVQAYLRHQFLGLDDDVVDDTPPFPCGSAPLAAIDFDDDDFDDDEIACDDELGPDADNESDDPDSTEVADGELDGNEEFQQAALTHGEDDDLLDIADVGPGQISPSNSRMYTSSQFSSRSSLPSPRHSSSSETHTLHLNGMTHAERLYSIVDACLSADERIAVKNRKQKVLPDRLFYMLMNVSIPSYDNHDVIKEVARSLPAIVYTFGASNWIFVKSFYYSFAHHSSNEVRQIVAKGLHKVAAILNTEDVDRDLVPLFKDLIYDDEASIYMGMLSNFSEFVYFLSADMRTIMLRNLNNYLSVETTRNWRLRELFALQCLKLCDLYSPREVNDGISCFALTFMDDTIGSVREKGSELLAKVLSLFINSEYPFKVKPWEPTDSVEVKMQKLMEAMPLTKSLLVDSRRGFFKSSAWRRRQTWAQVLLQLMKLNLVDPHVVITIFADDILSTANDKIPNTRLKFCKMMEYITIARSNGSIESEIDTEASSTLWVQINEVAESDPDFGVQAHAKQVLGELTTDSVLKYDDHSARVMLRESEMWQRLNSLYEEKRKEQMILPPTPTTTHQEEPPSLSHAPLMEQLAGQFPLGKNKITSFAGSLVKNILPGGKRSPNKNFHVSSVPELERSPPATKSSIAQRVEAEKVEEAAAGTSVQAGPSSEVSTPVDIPTAAEKEPAKEAEPETLGVAVSDATDSYFLPGEEVELDDDRIVPPRGPNVEVSIKIDKSEDDVHDEETPVNPSSKQDHDAYPEVDC